MDIIVNWVATTTNIAIILGAVFLASYLRDKFAAKVDPHWNTAIIPAVGLMALHISIYWIWPSFWIEWYSRPGFIVLQVVLIFGLYAATLPATQASVIGKILVTVTTIGILINFYTIIFQLRDTYIAPVGSWSEQIEVTPGSILRPERPVLIRANDGRFLHDNADGLMEPLIVAEYIQVQSKDREPVTVRVSR